MYVGSSDDGASAIVVYKNMFHLALEAFVLLSGWKKNPIVLRSAIFLKKYLMRAFHLKSFPRTTYPPQKPTTNRNLLYTEKHSLNFLIHIFFPIINISYIILSIWTVAYYMWGTKCVSAYTCFLHQLHPHIWLGWVDFFQLTLHIWQARFLTLCYPLLRKKKLWLLSNYMSAT